MVVNELVVYGHRVVDIHHPPTVVLPYGQTGGTKPPTKSQLRHIKMAVVPLRAPLSTFARSLVYTSARSLVCLCALLFLPLRAPLFVCARLLLGALH